MEDAVGVGHALASLVMVMLDSDFLTVTELLTMMKRVCSELAPMTPTLTSAAQGMTILFILQDLLDCESMSYLNGPRLGLGYFLFVSFCFLSFPSSCFLLVLSLSKEWKIYTIVH